MKEKNDQEKNKVLEQIILPPDPLREPKIASLNPGRHLLMSPMLEERFRFAGNWANATLAFTWLSLIEIENAWTDNQIKRQLALRKDYWPTSVLNLCTLDKLVLFAIDIDQKDEMYLVFHGADEPQVVSYFGSQEKRYDNLQTYLLSYLSI